jgi:hypothetical protein
MPPILASVRKEELLRKFRAFAERSGRVPGILEFLKESGAKKHLWDGGLWSSWRAFLTEGGFTPNELTQAIPDDDFLRPLAILTRQFGRFPTVRELKFARTSDPSIPGEKTYRNRFKKQAEMIDRLSQWSTTNGEYADILPLLDQQAPPRSQPSRADLSAVVITGAASLADSYVPPIVDCLPDLAAGHPVIIAECERRGIDPSVELERRVAIAFGLLGLDLKRFGQGTGRAADGVARCREQRWALIYDAKLRRDGFALGTEDRKFREYIEHHARALARDGVESLYFVVVSSRFQKSDLDGAHRLVRATKAKSVVLLEASALRALVDVKLRMAVLHDSDRLHEVFALTRIVTTETVAALT